MRPLSLLLCLVLCGCGQSYDEYRREVDRVTERNYREYRAWIDPDGLRGRKHGYDLDHMWPAKMCWVHGWAPETCASVALLRVMPAKQNRSEGCRMEGCRTRRPE